MSVYVVLEFDSDEQAKTFAEDVFTYPDHAILTPSQENNVHASIVGAFKKPTLFCDCAASKHSKGFTRGRKYGWWVCVTCGKPTQKWASRDSWFSFLGTNLIPPPLASEYRPQGWDQGSNALWRFLVEGHVSEGEVGAQGT